MLKPISVKDLGRYISTQILSDPNLRNILVEGEVVNLSKHKFTYFSLKDGDETISCVFFENLNHEIKNGDKVIVKANFNFYLRDSKYQLIVQSIEVMGLGKNFIKLSELKSKLLKKGYFDQNTKKDIPEIPYKIGLISGKNSAAYHDFVKVLTDNSYPCKLFYYPSLVQGLDAHLDIIKGITELNNRDIDLIVIIRGGGSNEDLSVFNNEMLADVIFESKIPILTGIGHEIDLSISDLVSDLYLSTPTKVAEYIIKKYNSEKVLISEINNKINYFVTNIYNNKINILDIINLKIERFNPLNKLETHNYEIEKLKFMIEKNIDFMYNQSLESFNALKIKITELNNNVMLDNRIFLKHNEKYIKLSQLNVSNHYYITDGKTKYKILVEEKINE